MCVVSNLGDMYADRWRHIPTSPYVSPNTTTITIGVSRQEFDDLKREVEQMKDLLRKAKEIDEALGNPDCEMGEKLAVLRRVAELVGVDLAAVLGEP